MWESKKRWFTTTEHVDRETGEVLTKAKVEREKWIKKGKTEQYEDKGTYHHKIIIYEYEQNRQTTIGFTE